MFLNKIPRKEPTIKVGIILPSDKKHQLEIKTPIRMNNEHKISKYISVKILDTGLLINDEYHKDYHINNNSENLSESIKILGVPAGRGFHWQKEINARLLGDIKIYNKNGFIFLINEINIEKYLMSVATSEMSASCPNSLLESQTIAARSWNFAAVEKKHENLDIDVCNDDCCQRYQGVLNITISSQKACLKTRGMVLMHNNKICDSRYSKSCGGITESNQNVWNDKPVDYLQSISDSVEPTKLDLTEEASFSKWLDEGTNCFCSPQFVEPNRIKQFIGNVDLSGNYFRWIKKYSQKELVVLFNSTLNFNINRISNLVPIKRGNSGRIKELSIVGHLKNGKKFNKLIKTEYQIRKIMHKQFLYSSAFSINKDTSENINNPNFLLKGAGWGHGVGLCQIGALGMALSNKSSKQILKHYFKNSTLERIYD